MTASPLPDEASSRRFPFGKLVLGVLAGFFLALGFGAGALLAYQGQYEDRIYPGVTAAGIDVSGLTREAATAVLLRDLAGYDKGQAVIRVDETETTIPYAALGRRADVEALVDLAWSVGRGDPDPLARAARGVRSLLDGTAIAPVLVVDPALVADAVERLAGRIDRAPVDASATESKAGFTTAAAAGGVALPRQEVADALVARLVDPATPAVFELSFAATPVEPTVTDAEAVDAVLAATRMARAVTLQHAKETWTIGAATVRHWITFETTAAGEYRPAVAVEAATAALTTIAGKVDKKPVDATFLVGKGASVVGVKAAKNGRTLDVEASTQAVVDAVYARAGTITTDAPPPVALAVAVIEPKLTTKDAEKAAPLMKRLAGWTTNFHRYEANGFGANISIPTADINGYVVRPGAVFDFWQALGPVTYERGYRDGGAILNGRTEPTGALAGGICSCSTTLFNAAARAGLEILDRDNHYYYIDRYPTGLDATVWKSGSSQQSMRFRNDTKFPILIRGWTGVDYVRFEIWGPPTGRSVAFSNPTIRNVVRAIDTVQYTTSLRAGQSKRIEYPVNGMQVWVTRTVRDASGKVIHRDTWYSDYKRVNGIVLVGKASTPSTPKPTPKPTSTPGPTPAPSDEP